MTTPDLALLDDPTEGLAPLIGSMLEEQIMSFLFFWNQLASLVF
jgi:ABC-type branched-subunit amino acid transport system ATPase component